MTAFAPQALKTFSHRIKLPSASRFASKLQRTSPYEKFFLWIATQMGGIPAGRMINVSAVWVHEIFAKQLDQQVIRWLKTAYRLNAHQVKHELPWIHLQYAPAYFGKDETWPDGNAYVREDLFDQLMSDTPR